MFSQPKQRDMSRRADMNAGMVPYNVEKGRMHDVFFLLRECGLEGDDGKPFWNPMSLKNRSLSLSEFTQGWEELLPEIARAIWEASLEVSPAWDWREQREEEQSFRKWADPTSA
jgi:hypothetical protein